MRIAAIYDIHANLPALEAVLHEIDAEAPELIVVGGDVAAGPLPRATIGRLMALERPMHCIRGNADRYVVDCFDGVPLDPNTPDGARIATAWAAQQLDQQHHDFLASFSEPAIFNVTGLGAVLFCHGSPRSDEAILTAATPEPYVRAALAGVGVGTVIGGHTHMQYERVVGGVRIVNAGSVGMPYGAAGAYWLLLGPAISLRRTEYDLEQAVALVRGSGYPQAEDFAARNILNPPSIPEAIAALEDMARQRGER